MGDIWYCVHCGYEVRKRGKCHNCKRPLTASTLKELAEGEAADEVGYSLEEWEDAARGELIQGLAARNLRHRFDGDELVVAAEDEASVDQLVDELSAPDDEGDELGATDGSDAAASPDVLTALYDAAGRLKVDPTDMIADGDLAEAAGRMFAIDDPPGVDTETWAAVGRVTRRLLGALGADEALEDEIAESSQLLCRLLEEFADQAAERAAAAATEGDDDVLAAAALAVDTPAGSPPDTDEVAIKPVAPLAAAGLDPESDGAVAAPPAGSAAVVDPDDDELEEMVYELEDWLPEERAQLSLLLEGDHIAHIWEGVDLVVAAIHDERVEALLAKVDRVAPVDTSFDDGEDDEARYHVISNLFGAADRLAGDGEDEQRQEDLVVAARLIQAWSTPFAMSDDDWWKIRRGARAVSASITDQASGTVISDAAAGLRDLLRKFV